MYNPTPIQTSNIEADQLYIQKLKDSIKEISVIKESAINDEDFATADQMKLKMTALQIQLLKMQDQFTSELLSNCVTQWQIDVCASLNGILVQQQQAPASFKKIGPTLLNSGFQKSFISLALSLPTPFYDAVIRAILIILPHELPETPKSPFGWDFLVKKIPALSGKSVEIVDTVKSAVCLLVVDILCQLIYGRSDKDIRRETFDLVLRHAFNYFHSMSQHKMALETEGRIFEKVFSRYCIIIGDISDHARKDIYRYVFGYLDVTKKVSVEEVIIVLSSIKYVPAFPPTEDEASAYLALVRELCAYFEKTRKTALRIAIIQALEKLIQPLDFIAQFAKKTDSKPIWELSLWTEVMEVYKKARKWSQTDDFKTASLKLMVSILVNSKMDFFVQNIDSYINTDLCPKGKLKPFVYDCILQLLRGRYFLDTRTFWRERSAGRHEHGKVYGILTRPAEEQSVGSISNRLNLICELLFLRRKGAIPESHLDTCAEIVVQISAHNIHIGFKLIASLLDSRSVDAGPDVYYVGMKAMRVILDPASGFQTHAVSKSDHDFETLIREVPFELEPSLSAILNYVDLSVGINALGTGAHVLDIFSGVGSQEGHSTPHGDEFRHEEEILQMLMDATDGPSTTASSSASNQNLSEESSSSRAIASRITNRMSKLTSSFKGSHEGLMSSMTNLSVSNTAANPASQEQNDVEVSRDSLSSRRNEHAPVLGPDTSLKEANKTVEDSIKVWFSVCKSPRDSLSNFAFDSALSDPVRLKKRNGMVPKLKPEQRLALKVLKEIIALLVYVPAPEFIGGNYFIGAYLNHAFDDVVYDVARTLSNIFETYPELRTGMINGFINYLKNTPHQDDISLCTILMHMSRLTQYWAKTAEVSKESVDLDSFYRVSCKLDACMLIFLARPNSRVRSACLQTLSSVSVIHDALFGATADPDKKQTLSSILVSYEDQIQRYGMYAFMERQTLGYVVSPRLTASMPLVSFKEIACSEFLIVYRCYLGELASLFAKHGRKKATRHCAKFLRLLIVPYIATSMGNVTPEYSAAYASYMALLMALAGVPDTSEAEYTTNPHATSHNLLFNHFKRLLPQILASEHTWETDSIIASTYFVHPQVIQLFVVELMQAFSEVKHNPTVLSNKKILDHILYILRYMCLNPQFASALIQDPVFPSSILDMYADFIAFASIPLGDVGFLSSGPTWRFQTAINFAIIVQRLSDVLTVLKMDFVRSLTEGTSPQEASFDENAWSPKHRISALTSMKEWYEILVEITPSLVINTESRDLADMRPLLLQKVSVAAERLMRYGHPFTPTEPLPTGLLTWFAKLESNGYRVFTPTFLYSFEDALGTVLVSSYSAKGTTAEIFSDVIFEQVLPRLDEGASLFLEGKSKFMSYAEDFFSTLHLLPVDEKSSNMSAFIYPDVTREDALTLRQHFGSLLFYGLFNLLHVNKKVRIKAVLFVRELLQMFNTEDSFDVESYFSSFTGAFYTSVGISLRDKVLELTVTTSDIFGSDSASFLWEAVRCSRSSQASERDTTLIPTQRWIMELIVPWCRYVNLSTISEDIVNAEFFRYLMDIAFYNPQHYDQVVSCWSEVVRSQAFGVENSAVLTDVLVQVCGRFDMLRGECLTLLSRLFETHSKQVVDTLAYLLSSNAFPWKISLDKRQVSPVIKDHITVLHSAIYKSPPEATNDYTMMCKSAVILISELFLLDFSGLKHYAAIVVNYLLLHLPLRLQDASMASFLLTRVCEGFISWLHANGHISNPEYQRANTKVKRLLTWLEMNSCVVSWKYSAKEAREERLIKHKIIVKDILDIFICIFQDNEGFFYKKLVQETLSWASEGFLGPEDTLRAIELYMLLIEMDDTLSMDLIVPLIPRILDQFTILAQLEQEFTSTQQKNQSSNSTHDSLWENLSKGKKGILLSAEIILIAIMDLHKVLIRIYAEKKEMSRLGEIFAATLGVLHIPAGSFVNLYSAALDNITRLLELDHLYFRDETFLSVFEKPSLTFQGVQRLLVQGLIHKDIQMQEKCFMVLLNCWCLLPSDLVDPSPSGLLYTLLYTVTWIFAHIDANFVGDSTVLTIMPKLRDTLNVLQPEGFRDVHRSLQAVSDCLEARTPMTPVFYDELVYRCFSSAVSDFMPEYINNITAYVAQVIRLGGSYKGTGIRMVSVLWQMLSHQAVKNTISVRNVIKRLPFLEESSTELEVLLKHVLGDPDETRQNIRDIDIASQGRIEPFPDVDKPAYTIKSVSSWFTVEMGIKPSNRMYEQWS